MILRDATALVTGAGRRLGRAIALALAKEGANVVVNYHRSRKEAEATAEEARALGAAAIAIQADVADGEQVEVMVARSLDAFGRIDLLVANAGVFRRSPIASLTEAEWDAMIRGNLHTFLIPALRIAPSMRENGAGCIVAVADVGGLQAWVDYIPYCVAKNGVIALTRALARQLAPMVRVNAVAPGPILFPSDQDGAAYEREIRRTLLGRPGRTDNVSDAVLFLARNDYVTGIVLPVDGGRLLG